MMQGSARSAVRNHWREAAGYQKLLYLIGSLLVASGLVHGLILLLSGGPFTGDVSFRKAASFGEAFGLTACSLAFFLTFLPRARWLWWPLCTLYGAATIAEVFLTTMQVWRGVPSHFNESTLFDANVFAWMGITIFLHFPLMLAVLAGAFTSLRADPEMKWAIRAGLLLLAGSQAVGGMMIAASGNTLGPAGMGKLPHALGLHGMQVLPGLALLLQLTRWNAAERLRLIKAAVAGYVAIVAVAATQAVQGRAPLDTGIAGALVLAAGLLMFGGSVVRTARGFKA